MTKPQLIIVAVLGICVLCVYCFGGVMVLQVLGSQPQQVAVAPVATTVPEPTEAPTPTATPTERATATRVFQPEAPAPTATRVIQPVAAPSGPLYAAWNKAGTAKVYRFEFDMTMKGALSSLTGTPGPANQEMVFFNMTGATNGKDQQMSMKGLMGAFLGGDPTKGFETMTVGGKTYIHGPVPMLGATENKWYVSDNQSKVSPMQTDSLLGKTDPNMDWTLFKKTSSETIDKRKCDVYGADKAATLKMFSSLSLDEVPNKDALNNLDSADIKFWLCDDGYIHQLTMNMTGHDAKAPSQTFSFVIKIHLYDFDSNIKITAPANPAPLGNPFLGIVTSTPTPKR